MSAAETLRVGLRPVVRLSFITMTLYMAPTARLATIPRAVSCSRHGGTRPRACPAPSSESPSPSSSRISSKRTLRPSRECGAIASSMPGGGGGGLGCFLRLSCCWAPLASTKKLGSLGATTSENDGKAKEEDTPHQCMLLTAALDAPRETESLCTSNCTRAV